MRLLVPNSISPLVEPCSNPQSAKVQFWYFPLVPPKAFLKPNSQSKSVWIWYFPYNLMGIWGAEGQWKLIQTHIALDISKGISQAKSPIKVSLNLIFSLQFYGDLGEQKPNENLFEPKFPSTLPKAFLKPKPQSKSGQTWYFPWNFMGIWGSRSPMKTYSILSWCKTSRFFQFCICLTISSIFPLLILFCSPFFLRC